MARFRLKAGTYEEGGRLYMMPAPFAPTVPAVGGFRLRGRDKVYASEPLAGPGMAPVVYVESDHDLAELHPEKFERVQGPPSSAGSIHAAAAVAGQPAPPPVAVVPAKPPPGLHKGRRRGK